MKNLLNYQSSEYDCGPVSLTNGLRYLFDREIIIVELLKKINEIGNDCVAKDGSNHLKGTSDQAMAYISSWFNHYASRTGFPLKSKYYDGQDVTYQDDQPLAAIINHGGAIITHVWLEVDHYVLVTGMDEDHIYLFDPYYEQPGTKEIQVLLDCDGLTITFDHPFSYNRIIDKHRFEATGEDYYNMGAFDSRVAVALINTTVTDPSLFD